MSKKDQETKNEETALIVPGNESLSLAVSELPDEKREGVIRMFQQMQTNTEDYGEVDVSWRPTIIAIKQPTSRKAPETAQNGDLYSSNTGRVYARPMEVVPLYPFTNRARFQPGAGRPDCRSEDEKMSIYGDICDQCDDRPWKDRQRQKCQQTFNIIATTPDFDRVYLLQFRGASFSNGKQVVLQAKADMELLHQRVYTLDTKKEEGKQGVYYVLIPTYKGPVDEAFAKVGKEMYDKVKEQRVEFLAAIKKDIADGRTRTEAIGDDVGDVVSDESPADFSDL